MTIWRMRFESSINKATDTHSEYVMLLVSFTETMLHYTYPACPVKTLSSPRMLHIVLFCITKGHCFPKTLCRSRTHLYIYNTVIFLESAGATYATAKQVDMKTS